MQSKSKKQDWLTHVISSRTFAVTILFFLLLGFSVFSWLKIPVEVMPKENSSPFLFLHVGGPPMAPETMELALAIPVEGAVRTVAGVSKFSSSTNSSGVSVSITFKPQTDMDLASFSLQEAMQDLEGKGILDMRNVSVSHFNPEASAVIRMAVTYDADVTDPAKAINEELRLGLEAIPEISKVEITGVEPPVFEFEVPYTRVREFGIQEQGLSALLNFRNMREALGQSALGSGSLMTAISARLLMGDLNELRHQTISRASVLTLNQIAHEHIYEKSKEEISRKNGQSAAFVEIYNKDGANLFDLNGHLKDFLEKVASAGGDLGRLHFQMIHNQTADLKTAIEGVFRSLYEAIIITFIVVSLFLRNWRQSLIICTTIPITLLLTISILFVKGVSLNVLTLSGLILGIGMVVDSAILVVGRIGEMHSGGLSAREASAAGASDVRNALFMSIMTNAAIFLPAAFIEGGDSFTNLLKSFQLPILSSLGSSFLVSLIFLPVLMIHWREGRQTQTPQVEGASANPKLVRVFKKIRQWRWPSLCGIVVAVILVARGVADIQQTDIESPRDPYTTINVSFAPEIGPTIRKIMFDDIEKKILQDRTQIGYRFVVSTYNPQYTMGNISLYPNQEGNSDEMLKLLDDRTKLFLSHLAPNPGVIASVGFGAMNFQAQQRADTLSIAGPKMAKITEIMEGFKPRLAGIPGVETVRLDSEENGDHALVFLPDSSVLAQYGLTLDKISSQIGTMMSSATIGNLSLNGHTIGARISMKPSGSHWTLEGLKAMKILISQSHEINLMDLGRLVPTTFTRSVNRNEGVATGKLHVYYSDTLDEGSYQNAQQMVYQNFRNLNLPMGYGPPHSDTDARIEEMAKKSQFVIILSGLLIYLLLGGMFESVLLPFAILFTVPLALLFGVAGLKLLGMDLDVMARLSLIILVGTSVNGAIILIDLINKLREQGLRRDDAIVIGCARRVKAVIMTMSIQIIGVLPVALGKAKIMGIPYSSLGISIISGTLMSTLVTLIVLPMIYEFLDESEKRIKAVFARILA